MNNQNQELETDNSFFLIVKKNPLQSAVLGALALYSLILYPYLEKFGKYGWSNDPAHFGVFGDYIGGLINPIFAFLSFIFVLFQWGQSQKRELESKLIQERTADLELKREERELKRDKRAREKFNTELFLDRVRLVDEGLRNFSYNGFHGIDALRNFVNSGKKAKEANTKMDKTVQGHFSMMAEGISVMASLNTLYKEAFSKHAGLFPQDAPKSYDPNTIEINQLEFLFTHYSEGVLIYLWTFKDCLEKYTDIKIKLESRTSYIVSISDFVSKNFKFPEVHDVEQIKKIFSDASKSN